MKIKLVFPTSFLLLTIPPLLGLLIGWVIWRSIVVRENSAPAWQQIGGPYKFIKIEDTNWNTVWARDINDKLYFREVYCSSEIKCSKWIKTKSVADDAHKSDLSPYINTTCPLFYREPVEPPGKILECSYGQTINYYALLEDGTIWYQPMPPMSDTMDFRLITYPFAGLLAGSLTAIILAIISGIRRNKTSQAINDKELL
jgi:hypothetical protein